MGATGQVEQPQQAEKVEIVTFQQDQTLASYEKPDLAYSSSLKTVFKEESKTHTIEDFLGTPVKYTTLAFGTNNARYDLILDISLPTLFYTDINFIQWRQKWTGLRFARYSIKFKFLVNASKGDTGRYLVSWDPYGVVATTSRWMNNLGYNTALPCVEVVVGPQQSAEFKVPFVSPYTSLDTMIQNSDYGRLRMLCMEPLRSLTSSSVARCDVWISLEDVELSVRTNTTGNAAVVSTTDPYDAQFPPLVEPESMVKEFVNGALTTLGNAVGAQVSTKPKSHSHDVNPIWLKDAVEGAMDIMGFSKPKTDSDNCRISNVPGYGFTNSDTKDHSVTLGGTRKNTIKHDTEVFASGADEMDIRRITSKLCWLLDFPWENSYEPGRILKLIAVSPGITPNEDVGYDNRTFNALPCNFVASIFEYWRGGMKYRLSAVKNDFYSGRLQILFFSGRTPSQIGLEGSVINTVSVREALAPKVVWDISETNDIVVTVPYLSSTPLLRSCLDKNGNQTVDSTFSLGTLCILVDTPLVFPEAVCPPAIQIFMYEGCSQDIAFAVPDFSRYIPFFGLPEPLVEPEAMIREMTFDHNEQQFYGKGATVGHAMLFSSVDHTEDMTAQLYCAGEYYTNLRPLTRRFGITGFDNNANVINIDPAWFGDLNTVDYANPLSYISTLFRFYTGSQRYKLIMDRKGATSLTSPEGLAFINSLTAYSQLAVSIPPNGYNGVARPTAAGSFQHYQSLDLNPVFEIECPYYSNVPMQVITNNADIPQRSRMIYAVRVNPQTNENFSAPNLSIYRAAGDDFSFGFQVGSRSLRAI
jgi:hypothetical protein